MRRWGILGVLALAPFLMVIDTTYLSRRWVFAAETDAESQLQALRRTR